MGHWLQLRPSPDQYCEFARYLCEAHSWYKHIPLLSGRPFVVFVAPDAGIGRQVAVLEKEGEKVTEFSLVTPPEGPEFTEEHPRLHYSWQTTREYRSRFGFLDYSCSDATDEGYRRDAGPPVRLPALMEQQCRFTLYPYVSSTFADAVIWSIHKEALVHLRAGADHPAKGDILELAKLAKENEELWSSLSESERDYILSYEDGNAPREPVESSATLRMYLQTDQQIDAISNRLQAQEARKIELALQALDQLILQGVV